VAQVVETNKQTKKDIIKNISIIRNEKIPSLAPVNMLAAKANKGNISPWSKDLRVQWHLYLKTELPEHEVPSLW
jgi:hypothetical protein